MKTKRSYLLAVICMLVFVSVALFKQSLAEQEKKTDLEARILRLEARIEGLEKKLNMQWLLAGKYRGTHLGNPTQGSIEARLQRLEKEVFDPDVKILPCE